MPNINAAILCAQMEQLDLFLAKKEKLANLYHDFFQKMDIQHIKAENICKPNYWLNTILLKDLAERNNFLEITNQHNIQTRPVWDLMNTLPMYTSCQSDDLTNSRMLSQRIVNIPSSVNYQFQTL
jgi:dTDP-4-amino-4,6-dideoxygalactose transaminase